MKIRELKIKNFRSIYDLTLNLSDLTILIGRNNSGKSSILDAIRIVFENLDQDIVKTVEYENLPEDMKDQIFGIWFFKNYKDPVELQVLVELDANEIDDELKELCKLTEEIRGALIVVRLEYLGEEKKILWKLHKLDLLGYVSEAPKKALKILKLYGNKMEGDIFSHCQIVNENRIINSRAFNKVIDILRDRVHIITPYYVSHYPSVINLDIKAILRKTLVPRELLEDLKKVLDDPSLRDYFYKYIREAKGEGHAYSYYYINHKSKMYEGIPLRLELFGGGEQILDCIIAALLSKGEGQVFLIEEPEIHMHPAYVKGFAHVLEEITKERNIQVITITQSPELIAAVKDKGTIVGVRKGYEKVFASPKPVTKVYRPYRKDEEGYLIDTLAHELGLSSGYFFFLDVAILVEGRSDKILLQHFINLMKNLRRLMYLPRANYDILEYRQERLKSMLKVLYERFKVKTFVITDNDYQGRKSAEEAKKLGLEENKEVFTLSQKDILCYIPSEVIYEVLKGIIVNVLKIDINRLKDIKIKSGEKTAMDILREIKEYGMLKNNTDLLRLLIHSLSNEISEEVISTRGWKVRDLYHTLKPIIAEEAVKNLKDVPDEIARVLTIIDNNVREVV